MSDQETGVQITGENGQSEELAAAEQAVDAVIENEAAETNTGEAGESAAPAVGEDFAEMLEGSLKHLHTGEKVTGIVTRVTPSDVFVDCGTKHAGIIPADEITDDPNVKTEDILKPGDEIEVFVIKVNDQEGVITLSRKRVDAARHWESAEQARADRVVVEGTVVEDNKGGVVVLVNGVRVFVPASQTGLPRDAQMSELLRKKVKPRITEVNRQKRRVVGSIRAVSGEGRREAAEKIFAALEVGQQFKGRVKSLTAYGAFIDIGGTDGMAHVTELSWERVKNPADVLNVGDEVDVTVIAFDKEKQRIQLTCKNPADDPWNKFAETYNVGDAVEAVVAKLMPFGAFATVIPGVDGLIHISQITDRHITRPGEVLKEGETVRVMITEIDREKHKIGLSIRKLIEDGENADAGDGYEEEPSDADAEPANEA